ncbi:MAG TPA: hypothetical protein VK356_13250 [Thermomicrobiales bacterium]|nr:hypothetical protein [Thermomicrobiales bacterium]
MVLLGIVLALGGIAAGMGPIAFVCGVLLLWSGIIKIVVLRIWRGTLSANPSSTRAGFNDAAQSMAEH